MEPWKDQRRPKLRETEDDLLHQMRNFKSSESSVRPENVRRIPNDGKDPEPIHNGKRTKLDSNAPDILSLLKPIVVEKFPSRPPTAPLHSSAKAAFPEVPLMTNVCPAKDDKDKRSLFFRQRSSAVETPPAAAAISSFVPSQASSKDWGSESRLLKCSQILSAADCKEIHEANIHILNSKNEQQLEEERQFLLRTLSPGVLNLLMRSPPQPETQQQPKNGDSGTKAASLEEDDVEVKKWINMDRLEQEKMAWMADLTPASGDAQKPPPESGFNARFDFKGNLMPYNSDAIAMDTGLHHHGEEPERPGYTLEELLTLSRSLFVQQKVIALNTLARVVSNAKMGLFDTCFGENLLSVMLKADLVSLLRIGLDDTHGGVVLEASMDCLAELLDNKVEESGLDVLFFDSISDGHLQPSLGTATSRSPEFAADRAQLKDVQLMDADVMLGLIRMDLLDRLAYLLDVLRPASQTVVVNMLRILIRMARHSSTVAEQMVQHSTLLKAVVRYFVPDVVVGQSMDIAPTSKGLYGTPLFYALKWLRILMSWSRKLGSQVLEHVDIVERVLRYISLDLSPKKDDDDDDSAAVRACAPVLSLTMEACRTWVVCMKYGLRVDSFVDFYPVLMKHVLFLSSEHVHMLNQTPEKKFHFNLGTAILEVISAAMPHLDQHYFSGILDIVCFCVTKWVSELCTASPSSVQPFCLSLLASGINVLATVSEVSRRRNSLSLTKIVERVEQLLVSMVLGKLLLSGFMGSVYEAVLEHSYFAKTDVRDGRMRDPANLVSLGCVTFAGSVVSSLKPSSPFSFMCSVMKAASVALDTVHATQAGSDAVSEVVTGPLDLYLKQFISNSRPVSNWFARTEIMLLMLLLELQVKTKSGSVDTWQFGMALIRQMQIGHEHLVSQLMRTVIFNPSFLDPVRLMAWGFQQLRLASPQLSMSQWEEALPDMHSLYLRLLVKAKPLQESSTVSTLTLESNGESVVPADWLFVPLLSVSNSHQDGLTRNLEADASIVRICLMWLSVAMADAQVDQQDDKQRIAAFRLVRLAAVFLTDAAIYLSPAICEWLSLCLHNVTSRCISPVKFHDPIAGLDSFRDFYSCLVSEFESSSYGNEVFAQLVLLPTSTVNEWRLRALLWNDHSLALPSIRLDWPQMPSCYSLAAFQEDTGSNPDMFCFYLRALASGAVRPGRNPVLYDVAVTNVVRRCEQDPLFREQSRRLLAPGANDSPSLLRAVLHPDE